MVFRVLTVLSCFDVPSRPPGPSPLRGDTPLPRTPGCGFWFFVLFGYTFELVVRRFLYASFLSAL